MNQLPEQKLFIDGDYVDAEWGVTFENINPATGELLCLVQSASETDVNRAVQSARTGFQEWSRMGGAERGRILKKAVELLREHNDELAALEVLDTGKPCSEASVVDVQSGADAIEYFAGLAAALHGEFYSLGDSFAYTRREPLGICAGIGAWNYPLQIACWKSAPALACGNAMIFKPSELTPLTALKLAEIYTEAGIPDGVFNVVQGGAEVGQYLTRHPQVQKVSLTGEVATGKRVMADAARTLKHVTMELGGKSPLIIFADADLENAVSGALMANFYTQGEICSNGTRVFIESPIYDELIEKMTARVGKMKVGDPQDQATTIGALISREHMEKVLAYIEAGKETSARVVCGGKRATVAGLPNGFFVLPTIFADCSDEMRIVREEIFGPVMCVLKFEDEQEVIPRANDTPYGLSAGVFTRDVNRAHRVIARLEAGTCWINNYNITPVEVPFGGYKQSGLGRENGLITLDHYTQLKTVYVEGGEVQAPF